MGWCVLVHRAVRRCAVAVFLPVMMVLAALPLGAQQGAQPMDAVAAARAAARRLGQPAQEAAAERFLAQRGWQASSARGGVQFRSGGAAAGVQNQGRFHAENASTSTWQPLGPMAVQSQNYGLVSGRVSALALDPSDATGNTLYAGTTGGGVWKSQNAETGTASGVSFTALTDSVFAGEGANLCTTSGTTAGWAIDASVSVGAVTVQPGGTGVILAGTGDPNDALDSYYGAGILRSTDNGATWCLIPTTADHIYTFAGEGFAGFAWSTANPQLVVAAVSQAYEGTLNNAVWLGSAAGGSYEGLYYSEDGGNTWSLATITDGNGEDVQGPSDAFAYPDGNAATAVVWNPVRAVFIAAVRYHGYYQSPDGVTWTRMSNQPGAHLAASAGYCPTNPGSTGSPACPIFRGALAVNPETGDTFAWTVDANNQDQGIWQDVCAASGGACANQTITFAQPWGTAALETSTALGAATIANGDYNLTLAAVPSGQETMVLAGANDLWKTVCPVAQGCAWRNTTNSTAGFCSGVGEYQHALAWNAANPLEVFVGNDSGLWRSTDAIGETGTVCAASDATHFQNLNGELGSLAEVESISQAGATPYTMMAGLGANGTAGVSSTTGTTADWPEILGGEGGPVAIDPANHSNWYANNGAGVSIYLGAPPDGSTPSAFNPVLTTTTDPGAEVVEDGWTMSEPAPFLVDPLDSAQLLIGTCRLWRGPASGAGWSAANAVSPILDNSSNTTCSGDALIRTMAAAALPVSAALPAGGEVVYLGMYGSTDGNTTLPGHVFRLTYNAAAASWSAPVDLTMDPVTNDTLATGAMNYYGLDISSIFIDPLDTTGQTVYVTVAGVNNPNEDVQTVYRSTDGGAEWSDIMSNLPAAPANSVVVDPGSAGTVYVATDAGVYATQEVNSCANAPSNCWAPLASGLPDAPVVALSAQPASASTPELIAATYGRGIWMLPLLGGAGPGSGPATDTLSTAALSFSGTVAGEISPAEGVVLTNSGGVALTSIAVSVSGPDASEFQVANPCTATLAADSSCTISVQFAPTETGAQTATLTIQDELKTQTVALTGTGVNPPVLAVSPASLGFAETTAPSSSTLPLTITNSGAAPLANVGFQITGLSAASFSVSSTTCGATLSNQSGANSCTAEVVFTPQASGGATALLSVSSSTAGVAPVTVPLSGTSQNPSGLNVIPAQLAFPVVSPGLSSAFQTVTLTNNGSAAVNALALAVSQPFSLEQTSTPCGTSLAAGASCTAGVNFSPPLDGPYTGTLTITSSSVTMAAVLLSGMGGVPGAVMFAPNPVIFEQTGIGQTSSATTVTLTNPDGVNSLSGLTYTVSAGFQLAGNNCSSTLGAGASCTLGVEFAPTGGGEQSGTLTVADSVLPAGASISLEGMGFDFAATAAGLPSQTVASGQAAYYTLSVVPLNGAQGVFTFACGTLPPYSSCTFSPQSVGIAAYTSGYDTLEIATGLAATSARSTHPARPSPWPVVPLLCGLVMMPLLRQRRRWSLLLVVAVSLVTGGVSSCATSGVVAGGNVSPSGPGITPAGTYTIPVTVTANGLSRQVNLTLIVD
ncbi:MAG: choice-of-anchor D domain-containing protein [Terracidiphilus sp.]